MRRFLQGIAAMILLVALCAAANGAEQDKFFLKANAGYNIPFLSNLSDELDRQGLGETVDPGYGLSLSLGRTFAGLKWAVEVQFSVAFFPEFQYQNDYDLEEKKEDFTGKLSHYSYAAILKYRPRPTARSFVPSIGAGLGYSNTYLISGGGKTHALEGIAIAQVETVIRDNISLLFEAAFHADITEDEFDNPYLENVPGDVVWDSNGNPLAGRFNSIEIHAGIVVWLKQLTEF
ncbi:MAG: outer membrane beta-barrel protein [bacterium]|nr:MAG: outer membrane beta-barrel protein [bacterium]